MLIDLALIFLLAFFIYRGWQRGSSYQLTLLIIKLVSVLIALVLAAALAEVIYAWLVDRHFLLRFQASAGEICSRQGLGISLALVCNNLLAPELSQENTALAQSEWLRNQEELAKLMSRALGQYLAVALSFLLLASLISLLIFLFVKILTHRLDPLQGLCMRSRLFGVAFAVPHFALFILFFALFAPALSALWPNLIKYLDQSFALLIIWRLELTSWLFKVILAA